jgi:hypothetical protein
MNFKHLKRLLAVASFGAFTSLSALADDPANGSVLYHSTNTAQGCALSGCHNATPLTSNGSKIYNARNARAWIQSNINSNNSGMGRLSGLSAQQVADIAAYIGTTPTTLTFPSTNVGSTSATQQVTVYASLKAGYSISALSISTSGDFARAGGTCAATVGTGLNCTILVTFTPTASGTRTGTLSISHNGTLTPIAIALTGTGASVAPPPPAPVASYTPTSLALGTVAIGSTGTAQSVTVNNTGNASLSITSITSSSADFTIAGGTCSAGGSIAVGAPGCTVSVALRPTGTAGAKSGSLAIVTNGGNGTVSLSGTATPAPAPTTTLTPTVAFGSLNVGSTSATQTAILGNTGNAPLTIGTLSTGSTEFAITPGGCTTVGTVPAGSTCPVTLTFTPSGAGARSATLTVTHNATGTGGTSTTSSLSGTGVALSPVIGVSPTSLSFSQVVNATSAAQTVTVSNSGTAALNITGLTLGGAQAAEYQIGGGSTCTAGGTVPVNASCRLDLTFRPTATGARAGTLSIAHNAAGTPTVVTLNGTGTAAPTPQISLTASTLTFASQVVGNSSASQLVTVSNSGTAALNLSALNLTGTTSGDFTLGGDCTPPKQLAVNGSCTVSFAFTPSAVGSRSATLTLVSDASNNPASISLGGTGAPVPVPAVALAPASLAFGNLTVNTTSAARPVTLSNTGTAALNISGITATSGFAVSGCGSSLAAQTSCTLSVTYAPTALGASTGSFSVASNAAGSPHTVSLTGNAVAASPVLAWLPSTTTSVAFGNQTVGAASTPQFVTLRNQGPGSVTLTGFTIAGTNLADFSLSSGGTCAVNGSLTQGSSCTLQLAFNPGAVGARSAILQVASTGTNPPDVALSGSGTAPAQPGVALTPTALSFTAAAGAAATEQTLTLQSNGAAVLQVTGLSIASGSFTLAPAATNGCAAPPFALQPGQSCAVSIAWSSSAIGTETGSVQVATNASATPAQVAITATRDALSGPSGGTGGSGSSSSGGGCSIAQGESLTDPTLLLLVLLSIGVLFCRKHFKR